MQRRPTLVNQEDALHAGDLREYINALVHSWCKTLTILSFTLVPIFFILDYFMMPRELLTKFAAYRLVATVLMIGQYMLLRRTQPGNRPHLHGYFVSLVVGGSIALMTTDLGGFNSTYYAGLNLVMFATTMLLPWQFKQAVINTLIIVGLYIGLNTVMPRGVPVNDVLLINNLYFLLATAVIAVSISYVKQSLIVQEFFLRSDLRSARDALWGEMEVAKQIQTSLLPEVHAFGDYQVAAVMLPADEVGGDYYDIIQTQAGESWLCVGDVSGHGVESGLIMMMTQTSIFTTVDRLAGQSPSEVLRGVNSVIKQNISRLGADRYMTITVAQIDGGRMVFAGQHQDILVYRRRKGSTEVIPTQGTWIGIVDDLREHVVDATAEIEPGDVVMFFTDGLTEATNEAGEMFGEDNVVRALNRNANLSVDQIVNNVVKEATHHMAKQDDDITVVVLKRANAS